MLVVKALAVETMNFLIPSRALIMIFVQTLTTLQHNCLSQPLKGTVTKIKADKSFWNVCNKIACSLLTQFVGQTIWSLQRQYLYTTWSRKNPSAVNNTCPSPRIHLKLENAWCCKSFTEWTFFFFFFFTQLTLSFPVNTVI